MRHCINLSCLGSEGSEHTCILFLYAQWPSQTSMLPGVLGMRGSVTKVHTPFLPTHNGASGEASLLEGCCMRDAKLQNEGECYLSYLIFSLVQRDERSCAHF